MKKIKLKVLKFNENDGFVLQIVEMDERFRGMSSDSRNREYTADNGWNVESGYKPEVKFEDRKIFLWGSNKKQDKDLIGSEAHCLDEILEALRDWSENWKGFKGIEKDDCIDEMGCDVVEI